MSETGRKLDVEDVLSSIRRLVSEEAREKTAAPEQRESSPTTPGPVAEKLVLTPSLRVPDDGKPVATSEIEKRISDIENLVSTDMRDAPRPSVAPADATSMISALSKSMRDFEPEEEPEAQGEPMAERPEPATSPEAAFPAAARTPEPAEPEAAEAPTQPDSRIVTAHVTEAAPEDTAPLEEIEATVEMTEEAKDDDASFEFPTDSPFAEDLSAGPVSAPAFTTETAEETDAPVAAETEGAAPVSTLRPEPPLRAPAIERAETAAEAAPSPQEPLSAAPADAEDPIDYTAPDEGSFIDEDMLREIVSDMVRSELQGELGDRITRNVRKLVRREIHRALASRDFE